jgi:hypothetical protein
MITVSQLILDALPRLGNSPPTGTTFYQAINHVASMLARRLLNRRSDMLVALETSWAITPDTQYYALPAGFVALREKPYNPHISDGGYYSDDDDDDSHRLGEGHRRSIIEPIDRPREYYQHRVCTSPERYELLGQQIVFYPPMAPQDPDNPQTVSVVARYYALPSDISGPTAVVDDAPVLVPVPFNGMFDQVFFQGVPRVVVKGLAAIQADPDFERFINTEVDTVLGARVEPLPDRRMKRRNYI